MGRDDDPDVRRGAAAAVADGAEQIDRRHGHRGRARAPEASAVSAAWMADPHGSQAALQAQRAATDKAVAQLVAQSGAIKKAPTRVRDRMYSVVASVDSLEYYRSQVDKPTDITAQQVLDQYTSIIDDQIQAFQELSQVDDGDLTSQAEPLVALEHRAGAGLPGGRAS
ncbi:nitrate- and nitrite sensing domain-containing protein [Streptomyces sp. L7]